MPMPMPTPMHMPHAHRYVREIDVLSQQYGSLKTKLQALGPEELVFRQPDDYSMTYRGSSLRGEPTLCADYMRRCGRPRSSSLLWTRAIHHSYTTPYAHAHAQVGTAA